MKTKPNPLKYYLLMVILPYLPSTYVQAQCSDAQITHLSGTQTYGCTDVTVTSSGDVFVATPSPCFYGPYWVGRLAPGSYIFSFSPSISGVSIDVQTLDNDGGNTDEMVVYINGNFYPITNPGSPDGCFDPAVIFPPGTVRGPVGSDGSWNGIHINENITTLEIANNWVSGFPAGFFINLHICCGNCQTDAGQITSNALNLCPGDMASVPPAEQTFLESDDILQYILFSDQSDPEGSILATSNTPEFAFDPATMQPGVTYYIAAIAGNDLGGNVDLTDQCLDFSNTIEVTWHPEPSVTFFSTNTTLCPDDCQDVVVSFTGTPPFQLSGEVTDGTNVISSFTETYSGMTGSFTFCLPSNTPAGSVSIQAIGLEDAFCNCN